VSERTHVLYENSVLVNVNLLYRVAVKSQRIWNDDGSSAEPKPRH